MSLNSNYNSINLVKDDTAFKILHLNIRSIRKNFDSFISYLHSISLPDIIILTETWIYSNETAFFSIPNYNPIFDCNDRSRSGGVAIFIHDGIQKFKSKRINISCSNILISVALNSRSINILGIYRSPSDDTDIFIDELENFLSNYKSQLVIAGDLNIDIYKFNVKSRSAQNYLNVLSAAGFLHLSVGPTRVYSDGTSTKSSEIDHCFIRDSAVRSWFNKSLEWSLTDHYAQLICMNSIGVPTSKSKILKTIDFRILAELIENHDWIQCVDTNDAENAVGKFTEELETMVSEATRVTILSAKTTCLKKWMTPSILKAIRVRDKLKKQHLNQPYNTLRKLRY